MLKHKAGVENRVADALSRKSLFLQNVSVKVPCFADVPTTYKDDLDFNSLYLQLQSQPRANVPGFNIFEGFLFKGTRLCLPQSSLREFVVLELHDGGLAGYFGRDKTINLVEDPFFCPTFAVMWP